MGLAPHTVRRGRWYPYTDKNGINHQQIRTETAIPKSSHMVGFCFPARLLSRTRNLPLSPPHERVRKVLDSSLEAAILVFEARCMRGGRINRRWTDAVSPRAVPFVVVMFEELMKANRAWRLQDTAGAAMRPARLLWSEPPPS